MKQNNIFVICVIVILMLCSCNNVKDNDNIPENITDILSLSFSYKDDETYIYMECYYDEPVISMYTMNKVITAISGEYSEFTVKWGDEEYIKEHNILDSRVASPVSHFNDCPDEWKNILSKSESVSELFSEKYGEKYEAQIDTYIQQCIDELMLSINEYQINERVAGYEKAEYEKYNSYASENGLDGTKIYIEGTVEAARNESAFFLILTQDDGKQWLIGVGAEPYYSYELCESMNNKVIQAFGTYQGFSDVFEMPAMEVISTSNHVALYDVETGDEYNSDYFYADDDEIMAWIRENSKEIVYSDCSTSENYSSYRKSTGYIESGYRPDYQINLVQLSGDYYYASEIVFTSSEYSELGLGNFVNGDEIVLYYYIDEDGEVTYFAIDETNDDLKFTLDDYKEAIKTEYMAQCKEYTYEDIARNPNAVKGEYAKFTGEVVQVVGQTILRVSITKVDYPYSDNYYYKDTIYVEYVGDDMDDNILKDDVITMYGILDGEETYITILNSSNTIPKFKAQYIDIN